MERTGRLRTRRAVARRMALLGAGGAAAACGLPGRESAPARTALSGTIRVAAFANQGQGYEFTQEAGTAFAEKTGVQVEVEGITGAYLEKLTTVLVADQPPDAFWNTSTNGLTLAAGGHGEAIDRYFVRDKLKWADFFPLAQSCVQPYGDGVSWALPVATLTYHFWHNRAAFREAGVAAPTDDWTFERDYFDAARRLTREGQFGTATSLGAPIMVQYVYAFGGDVLAKDLKSVALNGPESQRGLQWHLDLSQRHRVAPGPERADASLVRREVAMGIVRAPIILRDLRQAWPAEDIGLALMPKGPAGRVSYGDTRNFAISKASHKKEEAWSFLVSLLAPEPQKVMADTQLWTPVMRASLQVANWAFGPQGAPANMRDLLRQLDHACTWPRPAEVDLRTLFQNEYTKAFKGEQSLQASLANVKQQGDVLVRDWWASRR